MHEKFNSFLIRGGKTRISIFLHFCLLKPDNNILIILYRRNQSAQKKSDLYFSYGPTKSCFSPNLTEIRTNIYNYRLALLLIINTILIMTNEGVAYIQRYIKLILNGLFVALINNYPNSVWLPKFIYPGAVKDFTLFF